MKDFVDEIQNPILKALGRARNFLLAIIVFIEILLSVVLLKYKHLMSQTTVIIIVATMAFLLFLMLASLIRMELIRLKHRDDSASAGPPLRHSEQA